MELGNTLRVSTKGAGMNERGVSLVELCMVIAIVAIVAGVSLPGWATLVAKQQQRAVVMEIASELRHGPTVGDGSA